MMQKEIAAQAELLPELQPRLAAAADTLQKPKGRIFAGGCGDSAFAPRALSGVFRELGVAVEPRTSMEIVCFPDFGADDMVILSSISGGTKRTVEAAKVAKDKDARVVAVTCNAESALAGLADDAIVLPFAPLSRKTPHTLDYGVTLLALAEIARSFAGLPAATLASAVSDLGGFLANAEKTAKPLASAYETGGKIFILGAGEDLGTAEYAAAKFHEAGGLVAIAAETENFVHGMNFMIEPQDLLIALSSASVTSRRSRQVVEAFQPLASTFLLAIEENVDQSGVEAAFRLLLEQTFVLQHLCLQISNGLGLQLEEPRAGRESGRAHLDAQSQAMAN